MSNIVKIIKIDGTSTIYSDVTTVSVAEGIVRIEYGPTAALDGSFQEALIPLARIDEAVLGTSTDAVEKRVPRA